MFGEYTPCAKIAADNPAVTKIVAIHDRKMRPMIRHFISLRLLSHMLIPTTAPVMHCVDEVKNTISTMDPFSECSIQLLAAGRFLINHVR